LRTGTRLVGDGRSIVDENPIEVQRYLRGVDYPASKDDLASTAEGNGAPGDLVERIRGLQRERFDGPDDVMEAFGRG
jgi:Protein of unknown function (DUF2795)